MKAHNLARLVNDLRDIATRFYNHESLRDRISQALSDHGINEGWPTLDEYHLLALTFAYEKGFSAGLEGRNTENVFGQVGGQSAAFDVGLQEGRAASQRRKPCVPEGYMLVPIVPTMDMLHAALSHSRYEHDQPLLKVGFEYGGAHSIYTAMLAAAPKPEGW